MGIFVGWELTRGELVTLSLKLNGINVEDPVEGTREKIGRDHGRGVWQVGDKFILGIRHLGNSFPVDSLFEFLKFAIDNIRHLMAERPFVYFRIIDDYYEPSLIDV